MKRFSFLGFLLGVMTFAISFVSCSEDNDGEVKAGLVGVWEYTYEVDQGEYLGRSRPDSCGPLAFNRTQFENHCLHDQKPFSPI